MSMLLEAFAALATPDPRLFCGPVYNIERGLFWRAFSIFFIKIIKERILSLRLSRSLLSNRVYLFVTR